MGKALIITGADFSANSISQSFIQDWLFGLSNSDITTIGTTGARLNYGAVKTFDTANNPSAVTKLSGATITKVKFMGGTSNGELIIYKTKDPYLTNKIELARIPIQANTFTEYEFPTPITIDNGYYLSIDSTKSYDMLYVQRGYSGTGFNYSSSTQNLNFPNSTMPIDFYYKKSVIE